MSTLRSTGSVLAAIVPATFILAAVILAAVILAAVILAGVTPAFADTAAQSQAGAHEDLTPCRGSAPEPTQSGAWSVAFCNRTAHDIVVEFHDNDCPAKDWSRRGDVYQRTLRRGESKTLPLCYANEPQAKNPAPGIPVVRIPGGKGVVTTWNVVGDCGDRSKPLNLDARTFYDRGEYTTGIILLQYPSGASHCLADASSTPGTAVPVPARDSATAQAAPSTAQVPSHPTGSTQSPVQAQPPIATHSPNITPAAPAADSAAAIVNRSADPPTLTATVDSQDVVRRTVQVYAKGGAGYKCNFNLALTFSDGGSWNDRTRADITGANVDAPIATRKYLKSVSRVEVTATKCGPM